MVIPFSFDQVIEAIASNRGDATHFVLTSYLLQHKREVGPQRFRRLLETARLRSQDEMLVKLALVQLDPRRTDSLPALLRSTRTIEGQQVLLAELPDLLPREEDDAAALDFETWIRRRVKKPSYKDTNGASWEVPSILLAVLYTSDSARARALLMTLESDLDSDDRRTASDAIAQPTGLEFEQALRSWWRPPQDEVPPEHLAQRSADLARDAVKVMRRLGVTPNSTGRAE